MSQNTSLCTSIRTSFSAYLDGAVSGRRMQTIASHLETCDACNSEFDALRGMQRSLAALGPIKAPADLGMKLRLAISHERARRTSREPLDGRPPCQWAPRTGVAEQLHLRGTAPTSQLEAHR